MKSRFKSNVLYNVAYQIIALLTPLLTAPYLSRVIGAEGVGTYAYTNSVASYFFLFAMLGVNNYGNRLVAQTRDNKNKVSESFWQVYYIQLFGTIVWLILYLLLCFRLNNENNKVIFYIQSLYVFSAALDVNWFIFGLEKFKVAAIRSTLVKIISVLLIFVLVKNKQDTWIYTVIIVLGNIVGLLLVWPIVFKETQIQKPNFDIIVRHLKPNFILFIPLIASTAFSGIGKTILGILKNEEEVGYYNYATNIMNIALTAIDAIGIVLMPRLSNLLVNEKDNNITKKVIEEVVLYTSIIGVGMGAGMAAVAPTFVPLYLGEDYIPTANYLALLAIGIPIAGLGSIIRMAYLIPYGKDKEYTKAIVLGAIINIFVGGIGAKILGTYGICLAMLISYLMVFIVQLNAMKEDFHVNILIKKTVPYWGIGIFMAIVILNLSSFIENKLLLLAAQIIVGVIIYGSLSLFSLVVLNKDEMVKVFLRKKR